MNNDDLKALAEQLGRPTGPKGIEIADVMNDTNIKMTHHAIDRLNLSDHDQILELGHGNCKHLPYILKQKSKLTYCGLEISELMNNEARKLHQHLVKENQVSFFLYDGKQIPFEDNSFTKIFTVNTIYFWTDPIALLTELFRVLTPNGILNITFAQEKTMKKLPFTQFGFTLYDNTKLKALIAETPFQWFDAESQMEVIKDKMGNEISREFTTVSLKKI